MIESKLIQSPGQQTDIKITTDTPATFATFLDSIFQRWDPDAVSWQSITTGSDFLEVKTCQFTSEEARLSLFFSMRGNQLEMLDYIDISSAPAEGIDYNLAIGLFHRDYLQLKLEEFNNKRQPQKREEKTA